MTVPSVVGRRSTGAIEHVVQLFYLLRAVLGSSHDEAAARPGSADGGIGSAEAAEAYGEEHATHAAALPRQVLKNGLCVVPAEMLVRRTGDRAVSRVQRFVR